MPRYRRDALFAFVVRFGFDLRVGVRRWVGVGIDMGG